MKIEVANGEMVDKITILKIKEQKIRNPEKLKNIQKELSELLPAMQILGINESDEIYKELLKTNMTLWEIEDKLRIKELKQEFDSDFIQLARNVYFQNDIRSELKRKINIMTKSTIIEEKDYIQYK